MKKIILLIILFASVANAQWYKWEDKDGVPQYTDRKPPENVVNQDLPGYLQRLSKEPVPQEEVTEETGGYTQFKIVSPENGKPVNNPQGGVPVIVIVSPELEEQHFVQYFINGIQAGDRTKATYITMENINEGNVSLQAKIVDQEYQEVLASETVNFQFSSSGEGE